MLPPQRLIGLFVIAATCFAAAPNPAAEHEAAVAKIAKAYGVTDATPGFAVAVVENGHVVFRHGYGLANVDRGEAITPQTTFELASLSKTFTGLSICILHDRGQVSFDDDVRKYIPELPKPDGKAILLINLLRHTSGLPDYIEMETPRSRHAGYVDNEDYIRSFAEHHNLLMPTFAPGHQ